MENGNFRQKKNRDEYQSKKDAETDLADSDGRKIRDLAPRVRVNCICPGDVATPMLGKQLQQADGSYTLEDVEQAYPLERVGEPLEIAHVICSVLSPFNSFMTGSIIPVDGGLTAK